MIKAKKGFIMRRLGREHMIVAIGAASDDFNGMIRINETGAFYWKAIEKGITKKELAESVVEQYEDVSLEEAITDIEEFLGIIKMAVECDEL